MPADDPIPVDLAIQSDERFRRDAVSDIAARQVDSSGYGLGGFDTLRSDENTVDSTFRRCSPTVVSERPVAAAIASWVVPRGSR